jgi:hypothetical protein
MTTKFSLGSGLRGEPLKHSRTNSAIIGDTKITFSAISTAKILRPISDCSNLLKFGENDRCTA